MSLKTNDSWMAGFVNSGPTSEPGSSSTPRSTSEDVRQFAHLAVHFVDWLYDECEVPDWAPREDLVEAYLTSLRKKFYG
jgi:hypothetical protein